MDEVSILDMVDQVLYDLHIPPRRSQTDAFGISVLCQTCYVRLWTRGECEVVGRRLRRMQYQEITIRRDGLGFVLSADYPQVLRIHRVFDEKIKEV